MFTGIIESTATVQSIENQLDNLIIWLQTPLASTFKIDQSIAHNGICLTVDDLNSTKSQYRVTAVSETVMKTNIGNWKVGDVINIERAVTLGSPLDGHIVQGHVDQTAECLAIKEVNGSTQFTFELGGEYCPLIIEKGSIALNGISLTIFNVQDTQFTVAIIPYTMEHTNMKNLRVGDKVNIEFDILGKYIHRMQRK
jgi:riboflavin synthase